jgi:glucokinase
MRYAVGVDLGGTNLRVAAVREDGEMLRQVRCGTQVERGRDAVIDEMAAAVRQLADEVSAAGTLAGVGIGVAGILDAHNGTVREAPNLPGWEEYPVRAEIERRLGSPVVLENDANAAAAGEAWLGAARGAGSMAMITLGTGVGGGIVLGGRIWPGSRGMAGEFGHVVIFPEGPRCNCGNRGCVEQYASASAVVRAAREWAARGEAAAIAREIERRGAEFSAKNIYELAAAGDGPSREIFRRAGETLGILLADLVNVLNLEVYVIGGGMAGAWEMFAPAMFAELRTRSFVYKATAPADAEEALRGETSPEARRAAAPATAVVRAQLGPDAGLIGAARLAMQAEK